VRVQMLRNMLNLAQLLSPVAGGRHNNEGPKSFTGVQARRITQVGACADVAQHAEAGDAAVTTDRWTAQQSASVGVHCACAA
jgi:hypothetical protein